MATNKNSKKRVITFIVMCLFGLNHLYSADYVGEAHLGITFIGGTVGINNGVCFNNKDFVGIDMELGTSFLLLISTDWHAIYADYQHKFGKKDHRGFFLGGGPGFAYTSYETAVLDAIFKQEKEKTWEDAFSLKVGGGYKVAMGKNKKCGLSLSYQNNLFFHGSDIGVYWIPSIQTTFFW